MPKPQVQQRRPHRRGILARPLEALVFLLPLMTFYEITSVRYPDRVIAFDLLRWFIELFGHAGSLAPGMAVVVILVATHVASGDQWRVRWRRVGSMYVEATLLSLPLLLLNYLIPLSAGRADSLIGRLALCVGAGIYEELIFRLVFLSVVVIIGVDILRLDRKNVALAAILLSALAFAAHHHRPIGVEPFELARFAFRTLAGVYLAVVFWFRGYGPAAGCHAAYNVLLVLVRG
ncbi:MAG: type II CAAX prenyl endopeptidase Rce1 family protein [Phycisphaerae bacterium]